MNDGNLRASAAALLHTRGRLCFECTRDDGKMKCYIPFGYHPECDHISCWRSCERVCDRQNKESEMPGVNRGRDDRRAQKRTAGCRHTLCCAE